MNSNSMRPIFKKIAETKPKTEKHKATQYIYLTIQ